MRGRWVLFILKPSFLVILSAIIFLVGYKTNVVVGASACEAPYKNNGN